MSEPELGYAKSTVTDPTGRQAAFERELRIERLKVSAHDAAARLCPDCVGKVPRGTCARCEWQKAASRARQAEADRDDFRAKLRIAEEKARICEARAVDAERRATHAVGRARRLGVGFGNVKGDGI